MKNFKDHLTESSDSEVNIKKAYDILTKSEDHIGSAVAVLGMVEEYIAAAYDELKKSGSFNPEIAKVLVKARNIKKPVQDAKQEVAELRSSTAKLLRK